MRTLIIDEGKKDGFICRDLDSNEVISSVKTYFDVISILVRGDRLVTEQSYLSYQLEDRPRLKAALRTAGIEFRLLPTRAVASYRMDNQIS
jgi:hypothetical protein